MNVNLRSLRTKYDKRRTGGPIRGNCAATEKCTACNRSSGRGEPSPVPLKTTGKHHRQLRHDSAESTSRLRWPIASSRTRRFPRSEGMTIALGKAPGNGSGRKKRSGASPRALSFFAGILRTSPRSPRRRNDREHRRCAKQHRRWMCCRHRPAGRGPSCWSGYRCRRTN